MAVKTRTGALVRERLPDANQFTDRPPLNIALFRPVAQVCFYHRGREEQDETKASGGLRSPAHLVDSCLGVLGVLAG